MTRTTVEMLEMLDGSTCGCESYYGFRCHICDALVHGEFQQLMEPVPLIAYGRCKSKLGFMHEWWHLTEAGRWILEAHDAARLVHDQ